MIFCFRKGFLQSRDIMNVEDFWKPAIKKDKVFFLLIKQITGCFTVLLPVGFQHMHCSLE